MTLERLQNCCDVSIHAPTKGATFMLPKDSADYRQRFNPRPFERSDGNYTQIII